MPDTFKIADKTALASPVGTEVVLVEQADGTYAKVTVLSLININNAIKSYSGKTPSGSSGTFYFGGFYNASSTDANLNQGSTTVTIGTANSAYGAHAFIVSGGNGTTDGTDLVLTVSGTSITAAGVRTAADTEVIEATAEVSAVDTYFETTKKWIGQVTFTLSSTGGTTFSYDFNYGLASHEEFGQKSVTINDFNADWLGGANDAGFDIELMKHSSSGWTYAATGFVAGNGAIIKLSTDYSTERQVVNGEKGAYQRTGLTTAIDGTTTEGMLIRMTTTANNAIEFVNFHVGVTFN